MSVVIQLEGESDIFVNVSAHTFLKKQLSKLDVDKQFKPGYVDIQEIMGEYEVPVVEERKLVHLVPGTVLIFLVIYHMVDLQLPIWLTEAFTYICLFLAVRSWMSKLLF